MSHDAAYSKIGGSPSFVLNKLHKFVPLDLTYEKFVIFNMKGLCPGGINGFRGRIIGQRLARITGRYILRVWITCQF